MRYKGSVYRPPSEAYSLIVQVTYGCSHNTCAFCSMYKEKHFAIRPLEEVLEDFRIARGVYRRVDRVFLADGDALVRKANELYTILDTIRELFPECERVTSYASPASIRIRTEEELRTLRDKGLTMVYMGLESGCDDVLKRMRKGHMSAEIVEMGRKVRRCGMALSVTAITGLGGPELLERHAIETAEAFNAMNPEYIGMLTLMVEPETPLYDWVRDGSFQLLTGFQFVHAHDGISFFHPFSIFHMYFPDHIIRDKSQNRFPTGINFAITDQFHFKGSQPGFCSFHLDLVLFLADPGQIFFFFFLLLLISTTTDKPQGKH